MTHVLDFNPDLAFVTTESRLSQIVPTGTALNDPKLSLALAYIYVVMKYGTKTLVEPEVFPILSELFPGLVDKKDNRRSTAGVTITRIDTAQPAKYHEGSLLMPVYVSEASTIVYNIHSLIAEEEEYNTEAVAGALNFFNCAVRSSNSGTKRVIWKDPINQSTRLQSATYDRMFALWLADNYLSTFTDQYPITTDPLRTLGMAYRFVEIVEEATRQAVDVPTIDKSFSIDLLNVLVVPEIIEEQALEVASSSLDVNESKRDLFSVLFYLRHYKPDERLTEGRITLILTEFKNYSFVTQIAKLYPQIVFTIYEKVAPGLTKTKNVSLSGKRLVVRDAGAIKDPGTIIFSNSKANNAIMAAFKNEFIALVGSTTYTPVDTFSALFTRGSESIAYSVYDGTRKTDNEGAKKLRERVKQHSRQLEENYRDTKKWKYDGLSFDEAALGSLME